MESCTDEATTENQEMDEGGQINQDDYDEGEEEFFDDEDADEEAEAVAKRLGDALWADISKAYAQQGAIQPAVALEPLAPQSHFPSPRLSSPSPSEEGDNEDTLANAIQLVLDLSTTQPSLHQVLFDTVVPGTEEETLLNVLADIVGTKSVTPELAHTLNSLVQSIADCELFTGPKTIPTFSQEQTAEGSTLPSPGKGLSSEAI